MIYHKGNIPWNKGKKTGSLKEEHKDRISKALKGKTTWNKGKKYHIAETIEMTCGVCGKRIEILKSRSKKKYCSAKCYGKAKIGKKLDFCTGDKHYAWKEKPAYSTIHEWVRKQKGRAGDKVCEYCGKKAKDWANIDHKYRRELDDFIPLCRSCHIKYDVSNNLSSH